MECDCARLTVCFDEPFWVAVYEREEAGRLTVCRQEFGAEPKDGEVYRWLLSAWRTLVFSPAVGLERRQTGRANPKRVRRQARAAAEQQGVGTKAQQALSEQREAIKQSANFSAYTVSEPITFRKFISESAENFNLKIVSSLQSDAKPIIEVLNGIKERPKNICILTGPEGDMSPNEYSLAAEAGFLPVKIGQNVMKCDTASLTAMAICNAYYNLD